MKTSVKLLLILFILMIISTSAIIIKVHSDFVFDDSKPVLSEKQLSLSAFHQIEANGRANIIYTQDTFQRVELKADSSQMRYIQMDVKDGKLSINIRREYRNRRAVQIEITADSINEVDLKAGGSFESAKQFRVTDFVGKASAGADFKMDCKLSNLSMEMSAGSDARLSGECRSLTLEANAGSDFKAFDLLAQNAVVHANAGSTVKVNAVKSLEAHANSGSNIYYKGNPQLSNVDISSGGNLRKTE